MSSIAYGTEAGLPERDAGLHLHFSPSCITQEGTVTVEAFAAGLL